MATILSHDFPILESWFELPQRCEVWGGAVLHITLSDVIIVLRTSQSDSPVESNEVELSRRSQLVCHHSIYIKITTNSSHASVIPAWQELSEGIKSERLEIDIHWNVWLLQIIEIQLLQLTSWLSVPVLQENSSVSSLNILRSQIMLIVEVWKPNPALGAEHFRPVLHNSNVFSQLGAGGGISALNYNFSSRHSSIPIFMEFQKGVGVGKYILWSRWGWWC